jgi:hypothetical protein
VNKEIKGCSGRYGLTGERSQGVRKHWIKRRPQGTTRQQVNWRQGDQGTRINWRNWNQGVVGNTGSRRSRNWKKAPETKEKLATSATGLTGIKATGESGSWRPGRNWCCWNHKASRNQQCKWRNWRTSNGLALRNGAKCSRKPSDQKRLEGKLEHKVRRINWR